MPDKNKIKGRAVEKGYSLGSLANGIGISYKSLHNKLSGKTEFTGAEIASLISLLGIKTEEIYSYFFAKSVDKTETNTISRVSS